MKIIVTINEFDIDQLPRDICIRSDGRITSVWSDFAFGYWSPIQDNKMQNKEEASK